MITIQKHKFASLQKIYIFALLCCFTLLYNCKKDTDREQIQKIETPEDAVLTFRKHLYQNKIDSIFKKYEFNGSIAVYQDSTLLASGNKGFLNFKTKTLVSDSTIYAIGSVSKQFTAAMILLLEEQQKLKIDDEVSQYLEDFSTPEKKNITIHQLMNHTSGINDFGNGLYFKPGTNFNYTNKGYLYLGQIIEKTSGRSYRQNAKALFLKAGMKNTSTADDVLPKNFASAFTGNSKNAQEVANMPKRLSEKNISNAAGGILSTVSDLHRWNQLLYNGKILNQESFQKFISKNIDREHPIFGKMGYASGIMIFPGIPKSYFHSGYVKGSPSLNVYYPGTRTSLIILSNIADESKGKNAFFKPHLETKAATDQIETANAQTSSKIKHEEK